MVAPRAAVNHRFPSGPAVMAAVVLVGDGNRSSWPAGVSRSMKSASATQMLPSGPVVIGPGFTMVESWIQVMVPLVVIRPIDVPLSVNQVAIRSGSDLGGWDGHGEGGDRGRWG